MQTLAYIANVLPCMSTDQLLTYYTYPQKIQHTHVDIRPKLHSKLYILAESIDNATGDEYEDHDVEEEQEAPAEEQPAVCASK